MIIIKLGFLLALPLSPPKDNVVKVAHKKGKKSKGKKSQKSKRGKSSKGGSSKKSMENEKPPLPDYVYEVGKPKGFFHIEYLLFPCLEPCHIDVLHWDMISKIYSENNFVIYRNMIRNNTIWIPIMLEHKINEHLSEEQLVELRNCVIEFVISPNKKKMGSAAKGEKAKLFYIHAQDVNKIDTYVEAFEEDPNVISGISSEESKIKTHIRFDTVPQNNTILYTFDKTLLHPRFQKVLRKLEKGEQITFKEYIPPGVEPEPQKIDIVVGDEEDVNTYTWPKKLKKPKKAKGKSAKSKKSSKSGKKSSKKGKKKTIKKKKEAKIKVSGESYFTDASLCTYRLTDEVDNISDVFVMFAVNNLTKPFMIERLNPLVIKLKSLRNLPVQFLIDQKFTSIYLQYNIPNVARHIGKPLVLTKLLDNEKKIKINEAHVNFHILLPEFTYFLQASRLIVELLQLVGVYSTESDLKPSIFGTERCDYIPIPARPHQLVHVKPKSLTLAVACFDLSLLLHSIIELQLTEPFRHPSNMISQYSNSECDNAKFLNPLSINQINLNRKNRRNHGSPLEDSILMVHETSLKIQIALGCKINKQQLLPDPIIKYKRIIMVFYNINVAELLLSDILNYNQQFHDSVLLPNYYMYNEDVKNVESIDSESKMVTGFWIDNGESVIVYLEANRSNYCMEIVLNEINIMNESLCKCYYNSSLYFYRRIYENFLVFGGMFKITMKYPLEHVFAAQLAHHRKCVPKLAFDAIIKLDNIFHMRTSQRMFQYAMLPSVNELMSFNMEFGISHRIPN